MLDGLTIVYRSNVDLYFYVMGSSYENEVRSLAVLFILYLSSIGVIHPLCIPIFYCFRCPLPLVAPHNIALYFN